MKIRPQGQRRKRLFRRGNGPIFQRLNRHKFMARMKATRLQTLGQMRGRGKYIVETDPPKRETVIRHMHSTARWMARSGVTE